MNCTKRFGSRKSLQGHSPHQNHLWPPPPCPDSAPQTIIFRGRGLHIFSPLAILYQGRPNPKAAPHPAVPWSSPPDVPPSFKEIWSREQSTSPMNVPTCSP